MQSHFLEIRKSFQLFLTLFNISEEISEASVDMRRVPAMLKWTRISSSLEYSLPHFGFESISIELFSRRVLGSLVSSVSFPLFESNSMHVWSLKLQSTRIERVFCVLRAVHLKIYIWLEITYVGNLRITCVPNPAYLMMQFLLPSTAAPPCRWDWTMNIQPPTRESRRRRLQLSDRSFCLPLLLLDITSGWCRLQRNWEEAPMPMHCNAVLLDFI